MPLADMESRDFSETRRPRPRGRKRALLPVILRAATGLFARCGFEQTMDDVAKAAGVRKATLYSYFDSKPALIDAVVDRWLLEMPAARPIDARVPVRQQLMAIGLQLRNLAMHPAAFALSKQLARVEQPLSPRHFETWRKRNTDFEDLLAGLLKRHCDCEQPNLAAHQFLLLVTGDLGSEAVCVRVTDSARVESAVELILRAYPERASQSACGRKQA